MANGRILGAERMEEERMSWLLGEAYAVGRHKGEALLGLCLAQSAQVEPKLGKDSFQHRKRPVLCQTSKKLTAKLTQIPPR